MILQQIRQRAAANSQHIVLPEGEDARTLQAAEICVRDRIARITLIGDEEKIRESARAVNCNLNGVEILDHRKSNDFGRIATLYHELRRAKGVTLEEAEETVKDPLFYGNLLVKSGLADGSVAGATNTTAHTVRAAVCRRAGGIQNRFIIFPDNRAEPEIRRGRRDDLRRLRRGSKPEHSRTCGNRHGFG
jgi:phosphotransacetylase